MISQLVTFEDLNYEDRELYSQHLRVINKIVCSYSRYEAFVAAVSEIGAASKYTVVADKHVSHNVVYHFDEEGVVNTHHIVDEDINEGELS